MKMMLNDKEEDQDLAAGNPCHLLPPIQKGWECGDDDISISHICGSQALGPEAQR